MAINGINKWMLKCHYETLIIDINYIIMYSWVYQDTVRFFLRLSLLFIPHVIEQALVRKLNSLLSRIHFLYQQDDHYRAINSRNFHYRIDHFDMSNIREHVPYMFYGWGKTHVQTIVWPQIDRLIWAINVYETWIVRFDLCSTNVLFFLYSCYVDVI